MDTLLSQLRECSYDSGRTNLIDIFGPLLAHKANGSDVVAMVRECSFDSGRTALLRAVARHKMLAMPLRADNVRRIMQACSFDSGRKAALEALMEANAVDVSPDLVTLTNTCSFDSGRNEIGALVARYLRTRPPRLIEYEPEDKPKPAPPPAFHPRGSVVEAGIRVVQATAPANLLAPAKLVLPSEEELMAHVLKTEDDTAACCSCLENVPNWVLVSCPHRMCGPCLRKLGSATESPRCPLCQKALTKTPVFFI